MAYHKHKGKAKVAAAMREVHENIPSTVKRAKVTGKKREAMLRAIAFAKARKAGAKVPRPPKSSYPSKKRT